MNPGMRRLDTLKPVSPAFGLAPRPGRAFVANFAARAGGRAGKRRDRGRMIVRLDFHQDMRVVLDVAIPAAVAGIKPPHARAFDDRRIVGVRDDRALRMPLVRVADHREQRLRLLLAVDHPVGVEDLVPAMLGVGLREHHQLDVGRIALQARKVLPQVFDFVVRQRQPHVAVGALQRRDAAARISTDLSGCGS